MSDKIDQVHPELTARMTQYRRARDFFEGADALKAHDLSASNGTGQSQATDIRDKKTFGNGQRGGYWGNPATAYLPRLSDEQSYNDYAVYVHGAMYPNYLDKTRADFRGLIFSKAPIVEIPPSIEYMRQDCDYKGTPIEEALEEVVEELYSVSRFGWWVDRPETPDGLSRNQEELAGLRPYIVPFRTEDIINWEYGHVGPRVTLTRVVVREGDSLRELSLSPYNNNAGEAVWVYQTRVWTKAARGAISKAMEAITGKDGDAYTPGPLIMPTLGGKYISEIPFFFFSPTGGKAKPGRPQLEDLVQVALSLYQSSALLEHSRFTCGLATALATGFPDETTFDLGGLNVIKNSMPEADFKWVERKGEDCLPLERAVEQKTKMLIALGSRMLEESKKSAESAEALRIRSSGDTATCADIAQSVGRIASQALAFCARWTGDQAPEVKIKLTTDYSAGVADAAEITALDKSVGAGHFSQSDFNAYLRRVGRIAEDRTDEDIEADLEVERERRSESAGALTTGLAAKKTAGAE